MRILMPFLVILLCFNERGFSQANVQLNNLSNTSVNTHLIPQTANAIDLGSAARGWRNLHLTGGIFLNGKRFVDNHTTGGNVFIGGSVGLTNSTGTTNLGVGDGSLFSNTTGSFNSALGNYSMVNNNVGSSNVAVGSYSLYNNSSGYSNVAIGRGALFSNTVGTNLVAVGDSALFNQAKTDNYFPGWSYRNTAVGSKALFKNTTGYLNTAIGFQSLQSNTTGSGNTATGCYSLLNNTGGDNTATGASSLYFNTTGSSNTAIGSSSLYNNTTGSWNTGVGASSLSFNTSGSFNTAGGLNSMSQNKTGNYNCAFGYSALNNNIAAEKNTAVGYNAGSNFETSASTYLGHGASPTVSGIGNSTALGFQSRVTASNQVRIGNNAVTSIGGYAGWSNISDGRYKKNVKEDVPGLQFIMQLRPVTYNLDMEGIDKAIFAKNAKGQQDANTAGMGTSANEIKAKLEKSKIVYTGFVAQEVENVAKKLHYQFSGIDAPKNSEDFYALRYAEFVVPLVKAVQELSKENEELKKELGDFKNWVMNKFAVASKGAEANSRALPIASLDQNAPNPFGETTTIRYRTPSNGSSELVVTDAAGAVVRKLFLNKSGTGIVTFDAGSLPAGIYSYSIWTNGKEVSAKQMVVAR